MSLENLTKKLTKEIKRSPAKSAVLALLVPVAVYCIAPLVMKGLKKSPPPMVPPVAKSATLPAAAGSNGATAGAPGAVAPKAHETVTWEKLELWRSNDPLAKAAALTNEDRNPFEFIIAITPPVPVETKPIAIKEETKPALDVSRLPLELQATMIGGRGRRAIINGQSYREGQKIHLDGTPVDRKEKLEPGTFLIIEEIHPTLVTLTCEQQTLELTIKSSNQLGAGQIVTRRD